MGLEPHAQWTPSAAARAIGSPQPTAPGVGPAQEKRGPASSDERPRQSRASEGRARRRRPRVQRRADPSRPRDPATAGQLSPSASGTGRTSDHAAQHAVEDRRANAHRRRPARPLPSGRPQGRGADVRAATGLQCRPRRSHQPQRAHPPADTRVDGERAFGIARTAGGARQVSEPARALRATDHALRQHARPRCRRSSPRPVRLDQRRRRRADEAIGGDAHAPAPPRNTCRRPRCGDRRAAAAASRP